MHPKLIVRTCPRCGSPPNPSLRHGIRHALDEAESIGIRKSMEALADADLVLVVVDASQGETAEDAELINQAQSRPMIVVGNKSDLEQVKVDLADASAVERRQNLALRRNTMNPDRETREITHSCGSLFFR